MAIKCILFDADGVVINSEMFSVQYVKKHNIPYEEMLPFFKNEFPDSIIGKADLIEIVKPWLSKWKWDGTVHDFLQFWFEAEHNIDKEIVSVIKKLREKGIKCYLATNQEKYRTQYMLKNMGFKDLFDHVFSSAHIGHKKPDTKFFEFILNKLKKECKFNPNEILFFDDSKEHIESANKLGIKAHLYHNIKDLEKFTKPIINDLSLN